MGALIVVVVLCLAATVTPDPQHDAASHQAPVAATAPATPAPATTGPTDSTSTTSTPIATAK
jgi:hypothetical protein